MPGNGNMSGDVAKTRQRNRRRITLRSFEKRLLVAGCEPAIAMLKSGGPQKLLMLLEHCLATIAAFAGLRRKDRSVTPDMKRKSYGAENTFESGISLREAIVEELREIGDGFGNIANVSARTAALLP